MNSTYRYAKGKTVFVRDYLRHRAIGVSTIHLNWD